LALLGADNGGRAAGRRPWPAAPDLQASVGPGSTHARNAGRTM